MGEKLGYVVSNTEGDSVGNAEGEVLGDAVGLYVGDLDGDNEGDSLVDLDGAGVCPAVTMNRVKSISKIIYLKWKILWHKWPRAIPNMVFHVKCMVTRRL